MSVMMNRDAMHDEQEQRLDNEVAALTDTLLRGEPPATPSDDAAPLLDVARRLDTLIAPRQAPSPEFQQRLRAATEQAWSTRSVRPRTSNRRVWAVVAAAAAVVLVAFLLVPAEASFPVYLAGSAVDSATAPVEIPWRAVILLIGLAGIGVYWMYQWRRRARD